MLFRDYLAAEYVRLKHELAGRHRDDWEAYAVAKAGFVSELVSRVGGVS